MKKVLSILMATSLLFVLAACGGAASSAPASTGATSTPAKSTAAQSTAASTPAATTDAIVIGGLAPTTGNVAQYGIAANNGAMLAAKEINAAGGIMGRPVTFISYDEQGDPTAATTAYDRLVNEDGIVALVGDVTTAPTLAVAQKAVQDGIPMITPTGTGAAITQVGGNIFRACFTDPYQGQLMANYAKEKLGAKTVAVLYDTGDDYSKGVAEAFEAAAKELGLTVTTKEGYQSGATDFKAQLSKIKEGNPDVIMAPCYYGDAAMILTQARDMSITSKFLGPDGWDGLLNQVDESNYAVLNGAYYCTQYALRDPGEKLAAVMAAYEAEYGETEYLNMFAILGYEAMHLTAAAIEKAQSTDSAAIVEAMKGLSYDGVSGKIDFNGGQDPVREALIIEFVDGKETLLGGYSF